MLNSRSWPLIAGLLTAVLSAACGFSVDAKERDLAWTAAQTDQS